MTSKRLELNVMIEGQEGLTWERWQRLARAACQANPLPLHEVRAAELPC